MNLSIGNRVRPRLAHWEGQEGNVVKIETHYMPTIVTVDIELENGDLNREKFYSIDLDKIA